MTSARTSLRIALLALIATGCVRPVAMRAGNWWSVRTAHVHLETDVGRDRAIAEAVRLEETHRALETVFYHCADHERAVVDVTLLSNDAEMRALFPGRSAVSLHAEDDLLALSPRVVIEAGALGDAGGRQLATHELAHQMIDACFPGAPPWLHEGLATVFETAHVTGGLAVFGVASRRPTATPEMFSQYERDDVLVRYAPAAAFPSATALVHLDVHDFLAPAPRLAMTQAQIAAVNYTAAAHLAYLLALGPDATLRGRFLGYLERLRQGVSWDDAFAQAFGGFGLDRALAAFTLAPSYRLLARSLRDTQPITTIDEPMSPAAAQLELASIAVRSDATHALREAAEQLALASRDPRLRAQAILFAAMLDTKTHPGPAILRAAAIAPDDLDVLRAEALLALDENDLDAMASLLPRLAHHADLRVADQIVLAGLEQAQGLDADAHARAITVLRGDRGAWGAWSVVAHAALDRGEPGLAARVDRRLHVLMEHEGSDDMHAAIDELDDSLDLLH